MLKAGSCEIQNQVDLLFFCYQPCFAEAVMTSCTKRLLQWCQTSTLSDAFLPFSL